MFHRLSSERSKCPRWRSRLDVPVPEMVEQKLPETVSEDRIQQRTAEHISVIPVPQDVKELVEVSEVFQKGWIQQRFVEQADETPDISLAVKIVERPVTQIQQVVNTSVQQVVEPGDQAC